MFYKFIWNGGNDRVKRACIRNNYNDCGLRMIDPYHFSLAQKMTWVKLLFDNKFEHFWKTIELSEMDRQYGDMLWKSYAPESLLNRLQSTLLADSLRTWYIYRERACQEIYNTNFSDMGNQSLWYNRNIRSRTKHYFYYEDWCEKGILYIDDLLNPPLPGSKLFEELVLDFNISRQDRRKFNFLMKCIPSPWLEDSHSKDIDIFENITSGLLHTNKIPKFTYSLLNETCLPEKRIAFGKIFLVLMLGMILWTRTGKKFTCAILNVVLIHGFGRFISKFSIKQLLLMIFYSKLTAKILLFVISVKNSLSQSFMSFANVNMLILFGKIW